MILTRMGEITNIKLESEKDCNFLRHWGNKWDWCGDNKENSSIVVYADISNVLQVVKYVGLEYKINRGEYDKV